ncbi:sensor domain-containing protein [Mycolicibacterium sp. CBMA 226]|uniref:sensor domain-containing protein n=1 Tax=Mycolicibacterium sp. CBMA 226 TaxID=2606611 RepID=UPI0012DEAD8D|nr:sensor domain-containing protein [Mycolicibacterium sp. CBMA 226]MUL78893.1 sensor domain-containing protein [Mycolicibacterium sp. CBMA 226]QGW61192.1 Serine/threonine-protein kinase PknH [Mycolicibacterium sp.]
MSYDRNSDAEETSAWPGTQPPSAPVPPAVPQTGAQPQPWQQPAPQPSSGWVPPTPPGLAPGAPFTGYGQPQTPQMPTPATESGGSKKGILAAVAVVAVLAVGGAGFYFWTPISDKLLGQSSTTSSATSSATTTSPPTSTTPTSSTTATTSAPAPGAAVPGPGGPATPGPSAPPKAAAPVDPTDLQSYLATPDALSTRFGGADMQPQGLTKQPVDDIDVSPFKCSGAAVPGISQAYSGSGFTGFVDQVVNDSAGAHKFIQTLVTFRTADAAQNFVSSQLNQWKDCDNTNLTITIGGKNDHANLGAVATTDGVNTIVLTPPAAGSRQCERAMTSSSNVVIDVRACAVNIGTTGSTIARDISQKIAGPR